MIWIIKGGKMIKNENNIWVPENRNIYIKPSKEIMSQRKLEAMNALAEIRAWGLRNPVKWIEFMFGVELLDVQKYAIQMSWDKKYALWLATRNMGKALALDTHIPTPKGYKYMNDLKIGDYVYDRNKNPTKIINTSPIFNDHECYKVIFNDDEITCDMDHLWEVSIYDSSIYIGDFVLNTKQLFLKKNFYDIYIPLACSNGIKKIIDIVKTDSVPTKCISVDNNEKLLFKPSNKSYVDRADVNKTLKLVLKYNFGINDITTHSLRHTYGTRCIEAGMQPVVLQRLMGHTDISTTLNTYTDVLNDFKNEEIEKVNQYYLQKDLLDNKILDGNEREF